MLIRKKERKESMKTIDKEERDRILSQPYMTSSDVYKVLPVGINQAKKLFKEVEQDLEKMGYQRFNTRPRVIPTIAFKKKFIERKKK